MSVFFEILVELSVRLIRLVLKNIKVIFALAVGAGVGLAFGISLSRFGGVGKATMLMFVVIGMVVIAPMVIGFLNRIAPGR